MLRLRQITRLRDRSGLRGGETVAEQIEQVSGACLRPLAESDGGVTADFAGPGLALAKIAHVRQSSRRRAHSFSRPDPWRLSFRLIGPARQEDEHDAQPECHSQQKEHDANPDAPRGSSGRLPDL